METQYIRIAAATLNVKVANVNHHTEQIIKLMTQTHQEGVDLLCLPELSLTGYTCQDLFLGEKLLNSSFDALRRLQLHSATTPHLITVVGLPILYSGRVYNCAAVIGNGNVYGMIAKTVVPSSSGIAESRWFTSASYLPSNAHLMVNEDAVPITSTLLFQTPAFNFGIEFSHDMLSPSSHSSQLALNGADIVLHPAAIQSIAENENQVVESLIHHSRIGHNVHALASTGWGESASDYVYIANTIIAEDGACVRHDIAQSTEVLQYIYDVDIPSLRYSRRTDALFSASSLHSGTDYPKLIISSQPTSKKSCASYRIVNPLPFIAKGGERDLTYSAILKHQATALASRISFTHAHCVVIGISGGLDSTLALLVCARAIDILGLSRKDIIAVTMPGFGTTGRTYQNAMRMMQLLGVTIREISIKQACTVHLSDIDHPLNQHDVTYENAQARERTQILMDLANKMGGFVVGTGDLSELALGWATFGGDHISMYGINASVPKTLVKALVEFEANHCENGDLSKTLMDVVKTPISPELLPTEGNGDSAQVTEDLVGPYELHDFFLYHFLRSGSSPSQIYNKALLAFDGHDERVNQYSAEVIKKWLTIFFRRFFAQQFKRNCLPDGPKVTSCGLSPRGDWAMPSDADATIWLEDS